MRSKRPADKRLHRRRRAAALEARYQRLRLSIYRAALFSAGTVGMVMILQLLDFHSPGSGASDPAESPLLRHYALLIALIASSYGGAVVMFRYAINPRTARVAQLLPLGAAFAIAGFASFPSVSALTGMIGGLVWLTLLAIGTVFAGARLSRASVRSVCARAGDRPRARR